MEAGITTLIDQFQDGRIGRREVIRRLGVFVAMMSGAGSLALAQDPRKQSAPEEKTFQALGLNHIALRVTDPKRSKEFYEKHLGLKTTRESESSVFMNCGDHHFVALFRAAEPGMHHYCYTIDPYDQKAAAEKLRGVGIEPELHANRIYFDDPDGIQVQLAAPIERRKQDEKD